MDGFATICYERKMIVAKLPIVLAVTLIFIPLYGNYYAHAQSTFEQKAHEALERSLDRMAINNATNSTQFQSLVKGYNYTFYGFDHAGGIGYTWLGLNFELYNGSGIEKVVSVFEDEKTNKVVKVDSYPAVTHCCPIMIPIRTDVQDKKAKQELGDNYEKALNGHYPPLKQWKQGIGLTETICQWSYDLMYNIKTHEPICVTANTSNALIERGLWLRVLASMPDFTYYNATQQ